MRTKLGRNVFGFFACILIGSLQQANAQTNYKQSPESYITIAGTSTLHEWTMTSSSPQVVAAIESTAEGNVKALKSLVLTVQSQSIKSANKGMDKNAYSALKVDKYKAINFFMNSSTVQNNVIQCSGDLSIAGVTKQVRVDATCKVKDDKSSLICTGSKTIKMSDFQVEAPSFMFGTVKTGDEIIVSFNIELVPNKK